MNLTYYILFSVIIFLFLIALYRRLSYSPGDEGEYAVFQQLKRLPEDKYYIINDLMFHRRNGHTTQIDHVVVSPYGIFVIETKNISGHIYGSEYSKTWTRYWKGYARGGYYDEDELTFDNPVLQNGAHVKALYEQLSIYNVRLIPIIAFSDEAELKVNVHGVDVVYWSDVVDVIKRYKEPMITIEEVREICDRLLSIDITDKEARKQHAINAQINKEKYNRN